MLCRVISGADDSEDPRTRVAGAIRELPGEPVSLLSVRIVCIFICCNYLWYIRHDQACYHWHGPGENTTGVTDTERIYGVMRLHPLGPGDGSKVIFRHGRYDMGLVRSLVLPSPSEMDEFWRSRVAHPRLFHAPTRTTSNGCLVLDRTVHALWNLYGKIMQKRKEKPSRDKGIPKQPLVYL